MEDNIIKDLKKDIYFFDIDGTLLPEGKTELSDSNIKALKELKKNNIVFLCSGRNYRDVLDICNQIDNYNAICCNGAVTVYEGNVIDKNCMKDSDIDILKKISIDNDFSLALYGIDNCIALDNRADQKSLTKLSRNSY